MLIYFENYPQFTLYLEIINNKDCDISTFKDNPVIKCIMGDNFYQNYQLLLDTQVQALQNAENEIQALQTEYDRLYNMIYKQELDKIAEEERTKYRLIRVAKSVFYSPPHTRATQAVETNHQILLKKQNLEQKKKLSNMTKIKYVILKILLIIDSDLEIHRTIMTNTETEPSKDPNTIILNTNSEYIESQSHNLYTYDTRRHLMKVDRVNS